jgi:hypothetical protein
MPDVLTRSANIPNRAFHATANSAKSRYFVNPKTLIHLGLARGIVQTLFGTGRPAAEKMISEVGGKTVARPSDRHKSIRALHRADGQDPL